MKNTIRKIIEDSYKYQLGHIPSALSIYPIVKTLYRSRVNYPIILGKSFGLQAWFIDKSVEEYYTRNSQYRILTPEFFSNSIFNVKYTQQQLGLAAGYAVGYSIASDEQVICILSDGDCFLSSTISAMYNAMKLKAKVHFVIDYNKVQLFSESDVLKSFWQHEDLPVYEIWDYDCIDFEYVGPKISFVKTIKGFGCEPLMNNPQDWHYRIIDKETCDYLLSKVQPIEDRYEKIPR